MKQTKSKKDIAFEKERAKFRAEIRGLQHQTNERDKQIAELKDTIHQQEEKLSQQEEWIERLLTYTEITKEDLQMLIESEKKKSEVREHISTTLGIIGRMGGSSFYGG